MRDARLTRTLALAALLPLLGGPAVTAGTADPRATDHGATHTELSFAAPAGLTGTLEAGGFQVLVVLLPDAAATRLRLDAPSLATVTNHTMTYAESGGAASMAVPLLDPRPPPPPARLDLDGMALARQAAGPATLVVEADRITLAAAGAEARLLHRMDGTAPSALLAGAVDERTYRTPATAPADVHATGDAAGLHVHATGLRRVEWHNLAPACRAVPCPGGGGRTATGADLPAGQTGGVAAYTSVEAALAGGALDGTLAAGRFLASGPVLGVAANGTARLPLARGAPACGNCTAPTGQTLTLEGLLELEHLATSPDRRLHAEAGGAVAAAALDESAVAPALLFGSASVATGLAVAAGVGLLALLRLLPLLTRLRDPLSHPRRQEVYAYVQQRPGATFREVVRGTGLAIGSGRHHLSVLQRAGLVVERRHGHSLRYFENHGKYATGWETQVLLREPVLAALHAWVASHPGRAQRDILAALAAQGWPERTTRSRLHRLAAAGLVTAEPQGRRKLYRAAPLGVAAGPAPVAAGGL